MSKDSKQETKSQNLQLPKAPEYIRDSVEGLTGAIMNLGNRNPQDYVSPTSPLQNQAFSGANMIANRYGWGSGGSGGGYSGAPAMQGNPNDVNVNRSQGGGLFDSLGVRPPENANYDWNAIAAGRSQRDPNFQSAYNGLSSDQHQQIADSMGIADRTVSIADFARYHYENSPPTQPGERANQQARYREWSGIADPATSGGKTSNPFGDQGQPVNMGNGMYGAGPGGGSQYAQVGGGQPSGYNPLDGYQDASQLTRLASIAGPNTYDPSMASSGMIGDMSQWSPAMLDAQAAYDAAQQAGSSFGGASTRSHSLLDGLDNYMSPYTNDVVDTTLANNREAQGQAEAQRAAAAAGSGAARGTRNSIFEALAQVGRERENANLEAGLRDQAFNTGAGLSASDADRRQSASNMNAQLSQQAGLARQQAELQRAGMMFQGALSDQGYQNAAGQFNANSQNNRTLTQAGFDQQTNLANQGALNNAGQFNASQADTALNRAMQGAGQLANISNAYQGNERADMGLLSQLGNDQRQIDMQQRTADLGLLQQIMSMAGQLGLNTSQVTGISNTGTQNTTTSPGILDWIGAGTGVLGAVNQG